MSTLKNGLIAYYKFDGNSLDSLSTYNGTGSNISYSAAKINQGAVFNGANSRIVASSGISVGTQYSYSFWIRPSAYNGVPIGGFNTGNVYGFYIDSNRVWHNTGNGFVNYIYTIPLNNWTFITITRTNLAVKLYVNSVFRSSANLSNNTPFTMGCFGDERNVTAFPFNGMLDEIAIFNREITQAEVTALYNNGKGLSYPFVQSNFFPFFQ